MFRWEGVFRNVWSGVGQGQWAAASPLGGPTSVWTEDICHRSKSLTFSARRRPLVLSHLLASLLVCVCPGGHICHWLPSCLVAAESSQWMLQSLRLPLNFTLNAIWIKTTFRKRNSVCLRGFLRWSSLFLLEIKLVKLKFLFTMLECTVSFSSIEPSIFASLFWFFFQVCEGMCFQKPLINFFHFLGMKPWDIVWKIYFCEVNWKNFVPAAKRRRIVTRSSSRKTLVFFCSTNAKMLSSCCKTFSTCLHPG